MLAAQLKGKLTRKEEDLEDLLTSNVFGSIKYTPYENGLIPLLSAAEDSKGDYPLRNLANISNVTYEFWPHLEGEDGNSCEPDVLIRITHETKHQTIILVEAKYKSGKSSEADDGTKPNDQLAREWNTLTMKEKAANSYLLYATADFSYPNKDIEDAQSEIKKKKRSKINIAWISWRKLPIIFRHSRYNILRDLAEILQRQMLIFFEGISVPEHLETIKWQFQRTPLKINWSFYVPAIQWKFNNQTTIKFYWTSFAYLKIKWRFKN
ncbi:MAG: hypothetical protein O8C63_11530 [Candidatus Methanoperedens sp.]|nr:hypothetical protein [Candidatus Methanoperedens sp.]